MTTFFLAICRDCTPTLPMPFTCQRDRDDWANVHRNYWAHTVDYKTEMR